MSEGVRFLRRTGRTTRIVDAAIQTLFEAGIVKIMDHDFDFRLSDNKRNNEVLQLVVNRIRNEHNAVLGLLKIDIQANTIKLFPKIKKDDIT